MVWIKSRKRYSLATATKVFAALVAVSSELVDTGEWGVQEVAAPKEEQTLYLSPNGQLFLHRTGNDDIDLWDDFEAVRWLEEYGAPESAYETAQISIVDG